VQGADVFGDLRCREGAHPVLTGLGLYLGSGSAFARDVFAVRFGDDPRVFVAHEKSCGVPGGDDVLVMEPASGGRAMSCRSPLLLVVQRASACTYPVSVDRCRGLCGAGSFASRRAGAFRWTALGRLLPSPVPHHGVKSTTHARQTRRDTRTAIASMPLSTPGLAAATAQRFEEPHCDLKPIEQTPASFRRVSVAGAA